jgi:adenine phosphoribosyltransferase
MENIIIELSEKIREIKDFPKEGIGFKDISPILEDPVAFRKSVDTLQEFIPGDIDKIAAIESRGFIFGAPISYNLGCGFVMIRKPGKLPSDTFSETYELEYGTDTLEMHKDAIKEGERVIILDDVLATGGTVQATTRLIENCGGIIEGILFLVELGFLNGREKISGYDIKSLIIYE